MKCPVCEKDYPKNVDFCPDCGTKLESGGTSEPKGKASEEPPKPSGKPPEGTQEDEKECPHCGTVNPSIAQYCKDCGKDMEATPPTGQLQLESGDSISVEKSERWLGREDFVDYLSPDKAKFISREKHFQISRDDEKFYILDGDSTNNTILNGEEIRGEGKKEIEDGDEIKVADEVLLEFEVKK